MPVESLADKKSRGRKVLKLLREHYARCSLDFKTTHQLMVATILSAQCTDERVNMVTPELFRKYPDVQSFAEADLGELEKDIYTTGFYSNKARAIKNSARQILDEHGGKIPQTLHELVKLSGVGRKTGSVILGAGFGLAEGIVVDTHVARISRLLNFSREKNPDKIERDLMKVIPRMDWMDYSHLLIFHGRAICIARRPDCAACFLNKLCPGARIKLNTAKKK
jgi:endonuclease-3